MAAGSFLFENKLRPGCYIQIKGVPKASANMSERGTAVILMNADSGGLLTEISANDILTGGSSAKGFPLSMFTDTKSILNYVYPYVNKLFIGRLNSGGTKAQAVVLGGGGGGGEPAKAHGQFPVLSIEAASVGVDGDEIYVTFQRSNPDYGDYYIDFSAYDKNGNLYVTSSGGNLSTTEPITAEKLNAFHDDGNNPITNYMTFSGVLDPASVPEYDEDPLTIHLSGGSASAKATASFAKSPADFTIEAANSGEAGNNLRLEIYQISNGVVVYIYDSGSDDPATPVFVSYNELSAIESGIYIGANTFNAFVDSNDNSVAITQYVTATGDITVPSENDSENPIVIQLSGGSSGSGGGSGDPLLTAKANYDGTFGNGLSVMIVAEAGGEGKYKGQGFFVRTSLNGEVVDEQNVKLPSELRDNDYLQFIKADDLSALSAVAAVDLAGGANGEESDGNLNKILGKLTGLSWNTLGFCGKDDNKSVIDTYIKNLRENKGKYRQAVLFNNSSSDYEGIVSPFQAFAVDDDDVDWLETPSEDADEEAARQAELRLRQMFAVGFVAAITAGSDVNISNTYAPVPANVIEVIPAPDEDEDVEEDLRAGLLTFTHDSRNRIVIEKDINTLHTYTQTRTVPFSKNRVIRCLDELSNTKVMVWEEMFIGKIDNNVTGRNLLKTQILAIIQKLVKLGALNESDTQIVVEPGDDPDKVRSYETVRPIDAMEQLYSYVTVLG